MEAEDEAQPSVARRAAIEALGADRGSFVLSYFTSTRPGLDAQMAMDVIPVIHEHLRRVATVPEDTKIDLILHSNGGDGVVPWRLVTLIREFCAEFTVLVPNRAFSAATLTALGADKVIMHAMGMLGPTDPTVTTPFNPMGPDGRPMGISVEDVASFISLVRDDVGIRHEDELVKAFLALAGPVHPLALGTVKRSTSQSQMLGEKLLRSRQAKDLTDHDQEEVIKALTSQLFYHGHPINRTEAIDDLGLKFVEKASAELSASLWGLFEHYDRLMHLDEEFNAIREAASVTPWPDLPAVAGAPAVSGPTLLPPMPSVVVESSGRTDSYETSLEVTVVREWNGNLGANLEIASQGWRTEL